MTTENTTTRGLKKTREGFVISNKMNKTVIVSITSLQKDAQYGKFLKQTHKFYAHDEKGQCKIGDKVQIIESSPISKLKRWRVQKILEKHTL